VPPSLDSPVAFDGRAMVRLVDHLVWRLRRARFPISTTQAIDVLRAIDLLGPSRAATLRCALAALVLLRATDRPRFDAVFDAFFAAALADGDASPFERLVSSLETDERDALLKGMQFAGAERVDAERLRALLDRGAAFDRSLWLTELSAALGTRADLQIGFRTHNLLRRIGLEQARAALDHVRFRLTAALGARGAELSDALAHELLRSQATVRDHLAAGQEPREASPPLRSTAKPFASLTEEEIAEVRATVRSLTARLRGGARVRARRARRGARLDAAATTRRAARTGGVPFELVRAGRDPRRARLVVLCDVSQSVRAATRFFLEFAYVARELFEDTRTFAFVSDLGETTQDFASLPAAQAIEKACNLTAASTGSNSNYGRVLRRFERLHLRALDRRTTVVVLGDGRSNFGDLGLDALERVRRRVRNLIWLCPEPRARWADADSAMAIYAAKCTAVYEVVCADDLAGAARVLARGH
jgi:uncharacterized protein with von Willebrand factor type A (vWA) domain